MLYWILAAAALVVAIFTIIYLQHKLTYFITHPWKAEKFSCGSKYIKNFAIKHGYFTSHPLVGKVSDKKIDVKITQNLLNKIHEIYKDPKKRFLAVAEVLTKVVAYRDLNEGEEISIPVIDKKGKRRQITYIVDKVFDIWNEMPAFGLIPKTAIKDVNPILIYRGTDFSLTTKRAISSLLTDLDVLGPGYHAYLKARDEIRSWLKRAYDKTGVKTRVMGFSLGGAFTSYTMIFENDLVTFDISQPSVSFNPPGVIKKVYRNWEDLPNEKKPPYLVFITKNDLVHNYGQLIGQIYKFVPSKLIPPIHAHVTLMIGQKNYHIIPIMR